MQSREEVEERRRSKTLPLFARWVETAVPNGRSFLERQPPTTTKGTGEEERESNWHSLDLASERSRFAGPWVTWCALGFVRLGQSENEKQDKSNSTVQ